MDFLQNRLTFDNHLRFPANAANLRGIVEKKYKMLVQFQRILYKCPQMLCFGAVQTLESQMEITLFKSTSKNPDEKTVQKLETRTENVETF